MYLICKIQIASPPRGRHWRWRRAMHWSWTMPSSIAAWRDLDIVLLDALEPFGFERLFPRGTLREPPASLARAHAVILTRADLIGAAEREALRERVAGWATNALWAEVGFRPEQLRNTAGEVQPLAALREQPVLAFCGIGNPTGFEQTLAAGQVQVLARAGLSGPSGLRRA